MPITKHTPEEAVKLTNTARGMFTRHEHTGYTDELTRENCGACTLAGYGEHTDDGRAPLQPNHAGWERAWVQARRPIPAKYREAFEDARVDANTAYALGLAQDIATYGVTFTE